MGQGQGEGKSEKKNPSVTEYEMKEKVKSSEEQKNSVMGQFEHKSSLECKFWPKRVNRLPHKSQLVVKATRLFTVLSPSSP